MQRGSFYGSGAALLGPRVAAASPAVGRPTFAPRCLKEPLDERRDSHRHASSQSSPRPVLRRPNSAARDSQPTSTRPPTPPRGAPAPSDRAQSRRPGGPPSRSPQSGGRRRGGARSKNGRFSGNRPVRWMTELVAQLKGVLDAEYPFEARDDVDAITTAKIVALIPEATPPRDEASDGADIADTDSSESSEHVNGAGAVETVPAAAGGDEEVPLGVRAEEAEAAGGTVHVQTAYDAELDAILQHYKASTAAAAAAEAAAAVEAAAEVAQSEVAPVASPAGVQGTPSWRPKIGEGSFVLLLRLTADAISPRAALQLYRALDAGGAYGTRVARFLGVTAHILAKRGCVEGAAEVIRAAALGRGGPAVPGTDLADAWASLGLAETPAPVTDLIRDLEAAGVAMPSLAYVAAIRAHARAGDAAAAVRVYEEMRRRGMERPSSAFWALAKAAVAGGDVSLALRVLRWAETEAASNPNVRVSLVWRELLALCTDTAAAPGLRQRISDKLAAEGHRVPCEVLTKAAAASIDAGHVTGTLDLFEALRERGLVSGLPVVPEAPAPAPAASEPPADTSPVVSTSSLTASDDDEGSESEAEEEEEIETEVAVAIAADLDIDSDLEEEIEEEDEVDAEGVFGGVGPSLPASALSLYALLIVAAHRARLDDRMRSLYAALHADGLIPNRQILSRMSASLPYTDDPQAAWELYEYMRALAVPLDGFMYGHVISGMLTGRDARRWWSRALLLAHRMHMSGGGDGGDTSVQTSMVVTAGRAGWLPELVALYRLMLQDAVMPRTITWNAFITAATRCGRPTLGAAFARAMKAMGTVPDAATYSALLSCTASMRDYHAAKRHWEDMLAQGILPDVIACTTFLWACICGGRPDAAVEFFEEWRRREVPPGFDAAAAAAAVGAPPAAGATTFAEVCTALLKAGRWDQGRSALSLQRFIKSQGEDPRAMSLEEVRARGTARGGRWAAAAALIAETALPPVPPTLLQPDPVAFSFAVTAYHNYGNSARAAQLADELASMDLPLLPNVFSTAIDGCAASGALDAALKLVRRARAAGLRPDEAAYGAVVAAAQGHGDLSAVAGLLTWMIADGITPNIIMANSALAAAVVAGDADAALHFFWQIQADWGLVPDAIAYATLCEALAKGGRWADAALALLISESEAGVLPSRMDKDHVPVPLVISACLGDPPELTLDLHGLSMAAAEAALRCWLLSLRRSQKVASGELDAQKAIIVTGRGRGSKEGVSRLRPRIEELVVSGFGRPLPFQAPSDANPGALQATVGQLRRLLEDPAMDLGLGGPAEEERLWAVASGAARATRTAMPRPTGPPPRPGPEFERAL